MPREIRAIKRPQKCCEIKSVRRNTELLLKAIRAIRKNTEYRFELSAR